jgi:hypothetical protein
MSSALRVTAQRPSKYYYAYGGIYGQSYENIVAQFASHNPTYVGSFILFDTADDFENAIFDLESHSTYNTSDSEMFTDLGKQISVGIKGVESSMFVLRNMLRTQRGPASVGGNEGVQVWVPVESKCNPLSSILNDTSDNYGTIYVTRA